jgi:hypothetical protein
MEDLLQENMTNHPITTLTSRDEQKKYKITNKHWSILEELKFNQEPREIIFLFCKIVFVF